MAGPLLAVAVTAIVAGRVWLRRRQHAAFAQDARQVTVLAPPQAGRRRTPELERVAPGVAVSRGEVVLDRDTDPGVVD